MRALATVMCAGLLGACTLDSDGSPPDATQQGEGQMPPDAMVDGVPFYAQNGFRCGPAAMATMLAWSGVTAEPATLEGRFYNAPKDPRTILVDTAQRFGRLAYPVSGTRAMHAELAAGHPVLILENLGVAGEPLWNCAVAVGYRDGGAVFLINGGDQPARPMSRGLLDRLWSDTERWGLVVLRPGEMPATARERPMVEAANGLARVGHHWEAVVSYDTVLSRWPSDADALLGLGASLYLLGDTRGAADAYRSAAKVAADPAPAEEALAHLLGDPARPKAQDAVILGPVPNAARDASVNSGGD
ncbi:MAG: PA2778 family cysteine peptidase [Magnetospirillum sp.]|nr:PA2778 family cysteine peptidase [Magnetospirillum sp.]